ncbi:tetratricopeptide repeat protein [Prosthecobacter sp.]|uniref:tetratricopeptide repeat protein n=1 Tax=Prosthecobacter sp. TaxID=1965333 RepID=UPI003783346C
MNRKLWISLAAATVLLLAVAAAFVLPHWRAHVREAVAQRHLHEAQAAVAEKHFAAALPLAQNYLAHPNDVQRPAWMSIEIEALAGLRHVPQLMKRYEAGAWRVKEHSQASLLVARGYLAMGKKEVFHQVLEEGMRDLPEAAEWQLLKADAHLAAQEWNEAQQWLEARHFSGSDEAARLCRLAMIKAHDGDLPGSWALLNSAKEAAPEDADVHSFRAQMLEAAGRPAEAAAEYVAAIDAQPFNPLLQDQLADFHLRHGRHDAALKILRAAAAMPHPDYMRLKTLFWGRVIDGQKMQPESQAIRSQLSAVIELIETKPVLDGTDVFTLPQTVRDRPEVFWLSLIQLLRQHREQEALDALRVCQPAARMMDPDLHEALTICCEWRLTRKLPAEFSQRTRLNRTRHQFLDQLHAALTKEDSECQAVLESPYAWSACLMACGWREAALQVLPEAHLARTPPAWVTYGMTQCLRFNRGPGAALKFIEGVAPAAPENQLLCAELQLLAGDAARGLEAVQRLQKAEGAVGQRARTILLAGKTTGKTDTNPKPAVQ